MLVSAVDMDAQFPIRRSVRFWYHGIDSDLRVKRHQNPRSHIVEGDIDQTFNLGIHPLDILGDEIM